MASISKLAKQERDSGVQLQRRFQISLLFLLTVYTLIFVLLLINSYRSHLTLARERLNGLTAIYEENTLLLMSNLESIMRAVGAEYQSQLNIEELDQYLDETVSQLPQLDGLFVLNEDAIVVADSRIGDSDAIGNDNSEGILFRVHSENQTDSIFIRATPIRTAYNVSWVIPISRAIRDENGNLQGVVVAAIDATYFSGSLTTLLEGENLSSISGYILNSSDAILATIPLRDEAFGIVVSDHAIQAQLDRGITQNVFEGPGLTSESTAVTSYKYIQPYDLTVIFQQSRAEVLNEFENEAVIHLIIFLGLSSVTYMVLRRQLKQAQTIQLEAQLRQQVQFDYQTLAENIPDFVARFDWDLRHVYVNTALAQSVSIPKDKYIGKTNQELGMPDEQVALWDRAINAVFKTGNPGVIEFSYETLEGVQDFQARLMPEYDPYGKVETVLSIVHDVSEIKRIQTQLEANQKRLQTALSIGGIGVYEHRVPLDENTFYSDSWADLLGYELIKMPPPDSFLEWLNEQTHPDDRKPLFDAYKAFVEGRSSTYKVEVRLKHKQGHWITVSGESAAIEHNAEGYVLHIIGVMTDVTHYRQMVEFLHQSEGRFRHAIAKAPIPMMIHDEEDHVLQLSTGWTTLSGYTISDMPTMQHWTENAYGKRQAFAKGYIDDLFEIDKTVSNGEWTINTKDNKQRIWDFTTTPLAPINNTRRELLSIAVDVTERKQAEAELQKQAQYQAAIGRLGFQALEIEDLQYLMNEFVEEVRKILAVDYCKILELLPGGDEMLLRAGTGWNDGLVGVARVDIGSDSQAGYTLKANEPVIVTDLGTETRFSGPSLLTDHGVVSGLSTVIYTAEGPYGVLGVHVKEHRLFSTHDVQFLKSVTGLLAAIIERKRAETALRQSEERWRSLTQHLPEHVLTLDLDLIIQFANYASPGLTVQDLIGTPLYKYVDPDRQTEINSILQGVVATGKRNSYETTFHGPDGDIYYESIVAPIMDSGEIMGLTLSARDITERKKAEQKVYDLTVHLESLVEERTAQLEATNQELNDFAYVVSHDLKAPLRGVTQLATWIVNDYGHKLDEEGHDMLRLMTLRTRRMHDLIEGILQYSRIGRVQEKHTQINLNTVVAEVIELLAPPDNIEIVVHDLPNVWGEYTRIQQVFQNLVGNAIKYMDRPDGRITIESESKDENNVFAISDNGPGIAEKYHDKIFQLFQSLSSRDEVESTGIGLALVKKIINLHDGKIWLKSTVGEGTTFYFMLPGEKEIIIDEK